MNDRRIKILIVCVIVSDGGKNEEIGFVTLLIAVDWIIICHMHVSFILRPLLDAQDLQRTLPTELGSVPNQEFLTLMQKITMIAMEGY